MRVFLFVVLVELRLKRSLELLAVRAMSRSLCFECNGRASGAIRLDRNISQPFRNTQGWLLHQFFSYKKSA